MTETTMTPAQRIKLFRRRAGLTQEQAAQLKGCTVSGWRKWESGERQVNSLVDWIEIVRILRVRDLYKLTGLPVGNLMICLRRAPTRSSMTFWWYLGYHPAW
jgi:transcriptional regulator with XRE-family HTH domain